MIRSRSHIAFRLLNSYKTQKEKGFDYLDRRKFVYLHSKNLKTTYRYMWDKIVHLSSKYLYDLTFQCMCVYVRPVHLHPHRKGKNVDKYAEKANHRHPNSDLLDHEHGNLLKPDRTSI